MKYEAGNTAEQVMQQFYDRGPVLIRYEYVYILSGESLERGQANHYLDIPYLEVRSNTRSGDTDGRLFIVTLHAVDRK